MMLTIILKCTFTCVICTEVYMRKLYEAKYLKDFKGWKGKSGEDR